MADEKPREVIKNVLPIYYCDNGNGKDEKMWNKIANES